MLTENNTPCIRGFNQIIGFLGAGAESCLPLFYLSKTKSREDFSLFSLL